MPKLEFSPLSNYSPIFLFRPPFSEQKNLIYRGKNSGLGKNAREDEIRITLDLSILNFKIFYPFGVDTFSEALTPFQKWKREMDDFN